MLHDVYICVSDDLLSSRMKLVNYYDSFFYDILMYTSDKEEDTKALHEIYVPMVWKKVEDPENIHQDIEINSPLELLKQVNSAQKLQRKTS